MRITYLKLKNFIGIYNGTGLTEFELDFYNNTNRIILLVGKNGSGKSTLISTLHPFADTMDDRPNIILSDKDGYKEIHIEHNGRTYVIKHHYANKTKRKSVKSFISYIDENGEEVELNETGTVNSFKEVVKRELDVDQEFFTLSRIGSNVSNFIEFKPTERKKFISKFLPNIEEYLYNYKIVNDKWSACKKDMKSLTDEMNRLDDEEHLESRKLTCEGRIESLNKQIESENAKISENKGKINVLDPDSSLQNKYISLATEFKEVKAIIDVYESNIKYPSLINLNETNYKIGQAESKITLRTHEQETFNQKIQELNNSKLRIKNDLEDKLLDLSKFKLDKNLNEYKELKEEYDTKLVNLTDEINTMINSNDYLESYNNVTVEELESYPSTIQNIIDWIDKIKTSTNTDIISESLNSCQEEVVNEINELTAKKLKLMEHLSKEKDNNRILLGNARQKDILDQRPANCIDDTCPFIKEAIKFIDIDKELEASQGLIDVYEKEFSKTELRLEKLIENKNKFAELNSVYTSMVSNPILMKMHFFKEIDWKFFSDFVLKNKDQYKNISEILDYKYTLNEINVIKNEKLPEVEKNIELLENKQTLIDMLEKDIERLNDDLESIEKEIDENTESLNDVSSKLTKLNAMHKTLLEAREYFTEKEEVEAKYISLRKEILSINDTIDKIKSLNRQNKESKELIEQYKLDCEPYIKELDKVKFNLTKLVEYKDKKIKLEKYFNNLNIVRESLSPTKGIPLLFINVYLLQTKTIANKLLDLAFNGSFTIEDFELTDKDFFIRARKESGEPLTDISIASQGETSLASLTISLALIQQSLRKYNILLLDEIDAELDASNRRAFIDLLEKQFDSLGIEQCFLITHNKEFDSYPVDLILMKDNNVNTDDSEYMQNKNVLFKL